MKEKGSAMSALAHGDLIKEGDYVFDDFGKPTFRIGPKHPRIGTKYCRYSDLPICREHTGSQHFSETT